MKTYYNFSCQDDFYRLGQFKNTEDAETFCYTNNIPVGYIFDENQLWKLNVILDDTSGERFFDSKNGITDFKKYESL